MCNFNSKKKPCFCGVIVNGYRVYLKYFLHRPAYATPKLLDRVGLEFADIDVFEYHEAFAVSYPCTYI